MLLKRPVQTKINIIDSIMGSGKTSWAIQFMKTHQHIKNLFTLPLQK